MGIEFNGLFTFLYQFLVLWGLLSAPFWNQALAETLIRDEKVSEDEYRSYLSQETNLVSFKEYFVKKHNYLDYALVKDFIEAEEQSNPAKQLDLIELLYKKLGGSYLSNQSRELWLQLLSIEQSNRQSHKNSNLDSQIKAVQNKSNLFEKRAGKDFLKISELQLSEDDSILINGWPIDLDEREKIYLNKSLKYHLTLLSNSKTPFIKLDNPDKFNIRRGALVAGSCDKPEFNSSIEDFKGNKVAALFDGPCLGRYSGQSNDKFSYGESLGNSNSIKNNWRKSPYTYGALLLGIVVLANYNELKQYRIRITLPF
jgi:hypothetical protein